MAEEALRKSQYSYAANANLVLQADRSLLPRRDLEPTGEAESLFGKIDFKRMGDRAAKTKSLGKLPKASLKSFSAPIDKNLMTLDDIDDEIFYQPKTSQNLKIYELMLSFLSKYLGDVSQSTLKSACNSIIEILKSEEKDFDKKTQIQQVLLQDLLQDQFSILINLGKQITDYDPQQQPLDDQMDNDGVAVVFDDDESGDEEFEINDNVIEEDGEEADMNTLLRQGAVKEEVDEEMIDEFTTTLAAAAPNSKSDSKVNPKKIDAFWHQRLISIHYPEVQMAQAKASAAMDILCSDASFRDVENDLMALFDYEKFDLVKVLTVNRDALVWCTRLSKALSPEDRSNIINQMREIDLDWIIDELEGKVSSTEAMPMDIDKKEKATTATAMPKETVNLEALVFAQGGHLMTNKKCKLPEGTEKFSKKGYEEVHVPAPAHKPMNKNERLMKVSEMPEWVQPAFSGAQSLNRIQSRVYPIAFEDDENMLLCAPTGAGKTNCAMLAIMREIGKYRDPVTGTLDLDKFKIVYVAPMKALVAEMVGNFGARLKVYGINVAELTGDRQLNKQQISETQIIVTTPEKWDIITRKSTDTSYTKLVRLIIIDEIHLLHDSRGPVLEAIIARTIRQMQTSQELVRLVGLSATLPNYKDVANFMRVEEKGLFFFDGSYRPCPLKQQYVAISEKKAIKRLQMMNEIVYEKLTEELLKNPDNQILVFCHSRKETAKTARAIRDLAVARETIGTILRQDVASREILAAEAESVKNEDLKELLPYGFAIHHAGMARVDRTLVEELFADKHIPVLCSTATLAWGVNLPAHTVIIKGTQVYSPEKGRWVELSPQDMLQMLGRAGRPSYDTFGEGIVVTTQNELQYYLSLLNEQLPIESQMISLLPDIMNAEIVMGNIRSREDAVDWLGYTYLYIRMLRNGSLYGVTLEEAEDDPYLIQKRVDFVHAAAIILDKTNLIKYDKKTGRFQGTELGRIASYYYISHTSMATYNQHLKPTMTLIDLFRVFSLSSEFKLVPIRQEEKMELAKLLERVPIPVKEGMDESTAKINVLLQSYISQLKLDGFALMADMVYVTQSAGRILRAIFEICLKRGWAGLAHKALDLCKMVDKRSWLSMNPLRQFNSFPPEIIRKLERKDISFDRYYDLSPQELGELVGLPKSGKMIHKFVHQFPKLELQAHVQPITRSMLKMELVITPDFEFDPNVHFGSENFWIIVEDSDGEVILYHDQFILKNRYSKEEHTVTFTVPLYEPLPPNYFVSIISDRWLNCETRLPVSFKHLILPEKYPPHTELLDLQPLPVSALRNKQFESIYYKYSQFNPIQTQVFNTMYSSDDNALICTPCGSGKTVCAEFALLRLWANESKARCVYVASRQEICENKLVEWKDKFGKLLGGKNLVQLTGDSSGDLKLLEIGDIIFATPQQWDALSRRWKQRKNVGSVGLFVIDDIHLIGGEGGPCIEAIVSRMRYISVQTERPIRIVALGASLANARDLGDWIGATPSSVFNFHPSVRPIPLEIHIQGYNIPHFASLMIGMTKPCYTAIKSISENEPAIIFVPSRKQSRLTAGDLVTLSVCSGEEKHFLHCTKDELQPFVDQIEDTYLVQTLEYGVAFYHEAISQNDKKIVETLFKSGAIQVLVCSKDSCWGIQSKAHLVVIMGSQYFQGKDHRYVDYPIADVLHMMGRASRPIKGEVGRCVLMCQAIKKDFYKKFLYEALPVESHFDQFLHDHFNAEIVTKTIENKQDAVDYLTWTFLYRRMAQNPNYYNLQGVTHVHLSDHLSEMVETILSDLVQSQCIQVEDDDISPLNLGMISAYYYINYMTIEAFSLSLKPKTKLRGLLEIVSSATEFSDVPIRHHEDSLLRKIYEVVQVKVDNPNFNDPHFKTNILLQAHFARLQLPADLESDQRSILLKIMRLLQACVDVISSNGWLNPALATMELSQMCIQSMWNRDSPLKQIPHLTQSMLDQLAAKKIEQVFDVMEMADDDRSKILQLDNQRMANVARFVNRYPNIEVSFEAPETAVQGESSSISISLEREHEGELGPVIAPYFPTQKDEGWWLIVGDPKTKSLLAIKRVQFQLNHKLSLDFTPEIAGQQDFVLYFMCDSYLGVDQEFEFSVVVAEGEQVDEPMAE